MNVVIWLQIDNLSKGSDNTRLISPALNILNELYGDINILGTVPPPNLKLPGMVTLEKQDLKSLDFDLVLVSGYDVLLKPVIEEAEILGLDVDKFILDRTVCTPNFTLEKYRELQKSRLSIFSMNCSGGLLYHRFGLPFLSPKVNMFIKLLRTAQNEVLKIDYPVYEIGNTEWEMNHFSDFGVAERKWHERSSKIN